MPDTTPVRAVVGENTLLIVDDDRPFSTRLARAMEGRGFEVRVAESVADGVAAIEARAPA
jgi:two-component system response regulator RegA